MPKLPVYAILWSAAVLAYVSAIALSNYKNPENNDLKEEVVEKLRSEGLKFRDGMMFAVRGKQALVYNALASYDPEKDKFYILKELFSPGPLC